MSKPARFEPFEGFIENPGVENILNLLQGDGVLGYTSKDDPENTTLGYTFSIYKEIPKDTILRLASTEETTLLEQSKKQKSGIFFLYDTGGPVPFVEYEGLEEGETFRLHHNGQITSLHVCKWREQTVIGYFIALEIPKAEKGTIKSFEDLASTYPTYNFIRFLEDLLATKEVEGHSIIKPETRETIENFLRPYYEEEQLEIQDKYTHKLNLQLFGEAPTKVIKPEVIIKADPKVRGMIPRYFDPSTALNEEGQLMFSITPKDPRDKRIMTLSIEEIQDVQFTKPITQFDLEIHDAAITLLEMQGHFTVNQIWENVLTPGQPPSKKRKRETEASLDKLINNRIKINGNFTTDLKGNTRLSKIDAPFLNLIKKEDEVYYGNFTTVYFPGGVNGLYEHAKELRQIKRMPIALGYIPKLTDSDHNITLKGVLYSHISGTGSNEKLSRYIKISKIAENCGLDLERGSDASIRGRKKTLKDNIDIILDAWKREGFIKSFSWKREGNGISGVTINPNPGYGKANGPGG